MTSDVSMFGSLTLVIQITKRPQIPDLTSTSPKRCHWHTVGAIPRGLRSFLSSPLLVQGEVGAIPIATGDVQRQHTRTASSCTQTVVVRVARNLSLTLSWDKERG